MESIFEIQVSPLLSVVLLVFFAALAWYIPLRRTLWKKVIYTLIGMVICWVFALSPRMAIPFSTLLLVVVMRSCLYFQWPGRIFVAMAAFSSFVIRTGVFALLILNRLQAGGPVPVPRRFRGEGIQEFLVQISVGSIVFFGLVLLFVLLMVGTLISEYRSRQQLAMANQRLRRYSLLVEDQATLQERNRIARELHDSIGHCLTAQSIQLENVSVWFDKNQEKARGHLETARGLSREALASVRQSVSRLRQEPLSGVALPEAIANLLEEYEQNTKLPIESNIQLSSEVPKETAIAIYRLIQESLTNIAKHAQAQHVLVRVSEDEESYRLEVEDDGKGFEVTQNQRGFGMTSMRERAEAVKGSFQIESQLGQGCKIWVEIPRLGGQV